MQDIEKALAAANDQYNYCKDYRLPYFAPYDGVCWYCRENIYQDGGYTREDAGTKLITSCPFCRKSFCD